MSNMGQPGVTNENDGTAVPNFDEAWIEDAKRSESESRRYQAPPPQRPPAPWRAWTPSEQPDRATVQNPPLPPTRRPGRVGVYLGVLLGLIAFGALALRPAPASDGANHPANPAVSAPIMPPNVDTPAAVPAAPLITHATPAARPLPWTPAAAMPPVGPDTSQASVFATIKVGTCLATTADLRSITIVPCSGPHTDEVTLVRDLTVLFATTPTNDQIQTLNDQVCPAAVQAWTGGADQRYTSGYVWQFEDGVPGQVVRAFACTVMLSGHSPFSGTLRHAAA
jgi:hypothetical protein